MPKPASNLATQHAGGVALPEEMDKLLADAASEGLENISADDIRLPRLTILQLTSPQVADGYGRPGEILNSMTNENYGVKINFFALISFTNRIQFVPRTEGSGIICQARDGVTGTMKDAQHGGGVCSKCPQNQWGTDEDTGKKKPPTCTEYRNILVLPIPTGGGEIEAVLNPAPAVFSGKRTSLKPVTAFLGKAALLRYKGIQPPLWASRYEMTVEKIPGDSGVYFKPIFKWLGFVESTDLFTRLRTAYGAAKDALPRYTVDVERDNASTYQAEPSETVADDGEGDY